MALPLPKSSASSERVKVIVRTRPLSQKELDEGHVSVVEVFPENCEIEVRRPPPSTGSGSGSDEANLERKVFAFDAVYDERFSQSFLYEDAFRQLVDSVLEGFNGTIFAYGQTGTGKTFTMEGNMYNKRESMCCSSVTVVKASRSTVDTGRRHSSNEPDEPKEGSVVTVVSASADCAVDSDVGVGTGDGDGGSGDDGGSRSGVEAYGADECPESVPAGDGEDTLKGTALVGSTRSNLDDCGDVVGVVGVDGDSMAVNDDVFTPTGNHESEESEGVIPNAFKHIFKHIASNEQKRYLVRASYLEIYQEEIRDLLCKDGIKKCELKENRTGVYVKDLSSFLCGNFGEINALMAKGNKNRSVGATNMNDHSSRSHAIFMITVEVSEVWPDGRNHFKVGKLNLVDLAGSERQIKTGASGERLKEATKINLSLSALGNVIAALVDGKSTHIPYRDSKLTRLLQDSLGGNSRTIMVATVGPASFNYDETMTTLRYASRAKKIKNKPKINEDPKDAMLREYQEEISRLRSQLLQKKAMYGAMTSEESNESPESTENQNPIPKSSKGRSRARTAHSTSSSSSEQMKLAAETQRFQELAPLLQPYGLDHTTDPKYIMSVLEKRREALLKDTVTVKEEKDRLLQKLEETQQRVKMTETECTKLSERIQWLESKVLNGGKSLLDHTNEQQKLIEMKQQELAETRLREQGIRLKLAEHELTANEIKGALAAHQTDVEVKSRKLQKLRFKLHTTREELEKSHKDFNRQRKELTALQVDLRRELKLKRLIIDNFVPMVIRKLVENRIQHKEKYDGYYLVPVETTVMQTVKRPPMNKVLKLPLFHRSDSGTVYAFENVHYQDENILQLQLEMPKHLTTRYIPPRSNPYITSLMKRAFELAEQETVIDVGRHSHRKRNSHSSQSLNKPGSHAHVELVNIRLRNPANYLAHFSWTKERLCNKMYLGSVCVYLLQWCLHYQVGKSFCI